ncbi:MAG: glycine--tRNA ligase subunit beta, partial [Asticcacaulis sp.]|nr:glycine--tRNA ligase subunit beta [Asticcacaulis sp.]
LADKLDTLIGFFAVNEKPTGSKDPYALRRSALGILRIIREHGLRLSLGAAAEFWHRTLDIPPPSTGGKIQVTMAGGSTVTVSHTDDPPAIGPFKLVDDIKIEVLDFFNDRLKVQLREEGRRLDVLEATLGGDDVVQTLARIDAVEAVIATPEGEDLLALHKRAANIVAVAKTDLPHAEPQAYDGIDPLEKVLLDAVDAVLPVANAFIAKENYIGALKSIAALRQNVDAFLDGVLVNAEDEEVKQGEPAGHIEARV